MWKVWYLVSSEWKFDQAFEVTREFSFGMSISPTPPLVNLNFNCFKLWKRESNEKPFKCAHTNCRKSYTAKKSLRLHLQKIHNDQTETMLTMPVPLKVGEGIWNPSKQLAVTNCEEEFDFDSTFGQLFFEIDGRDELTASGQKPNV